jgi:crossover junction endodeoxyribonuclease RuvC
VFIERVNAFPGQGVASMFSLGMSYWGAFSVAATLAYETRLVEPKDWKKYHRLNKAKDLARGMAQRLFPYIDLSRVKDHGRAEALLIAAYGRHLLKEGA